LTFFLFAPNWANNAEQSVRAILPGALTPFSYLRRAN
jgi:hypothetical protein